MELVWHFDLKKFMTGTDFLKVHTTKTIYESGVIFENLAIEKRSVKMILKTILLKTILIQMKLSH